MQNQENEGPGNVIPDVSRQGQENEQKTNNPGCNTGRGKGRGAGIGRRDGTGGGKGRGGGGKGGRR
jgi:hypothetical protein